MSAPDSPAVEPRKHDKDHRRQAFIDAATHVFAEKGYACATTREIAERACCSEGLIHRYFGGKRGLLLAILDNKTQAAPRLVNDGVPESDDLLEEVEQIMAWSLDHAWANRDFMRVSVAQAITDPDIGRFVGTVLNNQRVVTFRERLRRHQRAGRIDLGVDLDALAEGISGITFSAGFFQQAVFGRDRDEVRKIVAELARILVRGITPGCGTGAALEGNEDA
jgi:AcrR family transcriptional regulator